MTVLDRRGQQLVRQPSGALVDEAAVRSWLAGMDVPARVRVARLSTTDSMFVPVPRPAGDLTSEDVLGARPAGEPDRQLSEASDRMRVGPSGITPEAVVPPAATSASALRLVAAASPPL